MDNKELNVMISQPAPIFFGEYLINIIINMSNLVSNLKSGLRNSQLVLLIYQLTKSGASMGANYREANRSRSKADFVNKTKICESEASGLERI